MCVLVGGGRLCKSTFHIGISSKLTSTYIQISPVRGTSMSENHDTKVYRHTRNMLLKLACRGRNWRHCRLLLTCRRHVTDITSQADAMYESYVEGEDVEVTEASGLHALSTFTKHSIITMRETERKTKKRILCGYTSAVHVRQHAKRIGSICLIVGTPYKERVMGLSLDRSLDDLHHHPEDCLLILIGTHLNDA